MEREQIIKVSIDEEMRESYLSYAMSVIVSRALPDARDGLKPVQRRILYAMYDMGLLPDRPYRKSARVVGEVLGKYHPHGDQSVYDAMVRMAQDFSMRYPLVDGQGNFGSIDGDAAAAMRYTEARMTPMGLDLLEDIAKDTVDFGPNFDETMREPQVLPASAPNLLVNGSSGIAVGMSTNIPPHNLGEVVDALVFMLDRWDALDEITVRELMQFVQGPDFPTGGVIFRHREESEQDALINAYATGRGRVTVRARAHVETMGRSKSRIVITELPYQVNKTNLISKIADLHREGRLEGLTDLRDESDRTGMRIIVETTRNVEVGEVLAELYRLTPMESTFSIIMIALVNGEPRVLTLKQALRHYLDHRLEVVRRRSEYDLARARERAHILEGLLKALANLDAAIDIIRRSESVEMARMNLMRAFDLSEIQAQAILDMPLRRLAALEQQKIREEYDEKQQLINRLEKLLATPQLMRTLIKEELLAVKAKYGDLRRTQIVTGASGALSAQELLPDERTWVIVGQGGSLARTATPELPQVPAKPPELPQLLLEASTQDVLYLFTADGLAVSLPVFRLSQTRELGGGDHWADLTGLSRRAHLADALVIPTEATGYVFLTTLGGNCKRIRVEDLPGVTSEPFPVMNVAEDDALGWARLTTGEDEVILATASGQAIRFAESEVRDMGLRAGGVMAIRLEDLADGVVAMDLVRNGRLLWSITDNGLAKASPVDDYPLQGRYGKGVINVNLPAGAAEVVAAVVGDEETRIIVTTGLGSTRTVKLGKAKTGGRHVKPAPLIRLGERNGVSGVVRISGRPTFAPEDEDSPGAEQLPLLE
ncbi:MAG: DNA gyrase subunit A [Chloroflexi bacterium]|nr:DNA gyrase subunit A [Chloroflexota bacterium]